MTEIDADPWIGQVLHGIELLELTGTGQSARVYRGVHQALGEPRAVKLFLADLKSDPAQEERFLREAKTVRTLHHPNIVKVLDAGRTADHQGFLVLEWLEGLGLDRQIAAQAPFPPRRAARILRQLLGALQAAHGVGLIHRDLKPANVMIAEDREANTETVKLIDFGLVRTPDSKLTAAGRWVGSPGYLAPEVRLGDPPSPRSDLYALGVMAYEMLSGKLPYGDGEAAALAGPPPPLLTQSGVEPLVLSMISGEPGRRPASASEALTSLEQLNFSRDPDLDTLVAPTALDGTEEGLSTATDPGPKDRPVLRIETRITPAQVDHRRSVALVFLALAMVVLAYGLGRWTPRRGRTVVAAVPPVEEPRAVPSALTPAERAFVLLRAAIALRERRPELAEKLDPLITRFSAEVGAPKPSTARLDGLEAELGALE